jgi:UDP-N-acetylglucosamine 2-epimerase (non-hydrolysing)
MTAPALIHLVAGARPNFMKIAPLWHALRDVPWCRPEIVHSGQHSDVNMSDWFFRDLQLPEPHHHLNAQTGSHATLTATAMIAYDLICRQERPAWTVVVGDVDSTIACALTAKKLDIAVAHLEAGLRSYDRSMPEEINRILTDSIADLLWTPSADADENLAREGVAAERIECVGNIMIDSLVMIQPRIRVVDTARVSGRALPDSFALVTLHRPSNVDHRERLDRIVQMLIDLAQRISVIFPVHPRTRRSLEAFGLAKKLEHPGIVLLEPLSYIEFMALVHKARFILTDSGGIQEESTYLGVPCLTLRESTERPVTVTLGTNRLTKVETAVSDVESLLAKPMASAPSIPLWDGSTAARVAESLRRRLARAPASLR